MTSRSRYTRPEYMDDDYVAARMEELIDPPYLPKPGERVRILAVHPEDPLSHTYEVGMVLAAGGSACRTTSPKYGPGWILLTSIEFPGNVLVCKVEPAPRTGT